MLVSQIVIDLVDMALHFSRTPSSQRSQGANDRAALAFAKNMPFLAPKRQSLATAST